LSGDEIKLNSWCAVLGKMLPFSARLILVFEAALGVVIQQCL